MKLDPYFTIYTYIFTYIQVNSKSIIDSHVRAKTIKLLKENMGVNLHPWIRQWCFKYDTNSTGDKGKTYIH